MLIGLDIKLHLLLIDCSRILLLSRLLLLHLQIHLYLINHLILLFDRLIGVKWRIVLGVHLVILLILCNILSHLLLYLLIHLVLRLLILLFIFVACIIIIVVLFGLLDKPHLLLDRFFFSHAIRRLVKSPPLFLNS